MWTTAYGGRDARGHMPDAGLAAALTAVMPCSRGVASSRAAGPTPVTYRSHTATATYVPDEAYELLLYYIITLSDQDHTVSVRPHVRGYSNKLSGLDARET